MPLSRSYSISSGFGYKKVSTEKPLTHLEGVPITIFRHQLNYTATVAKLAHFPGAPSVKVALLVCVFTIVLKVKVEIVIAIVRQQCNVLDTVALGSTRHIHARIKITINRT